MKAFTELFNFVQLRLFIGGKKWSLVTLPAANNAVLPLNSKAQWFPKALILSSQMPIRLPISRETVHDLSESNCVPRTPSGAKIKFVAWQLSGRGGPRLEDCPLGLNKLFSRAGRKQLKKAMAWDSEITTNIAEGISWMKLSRML